MLSLRFVVRRFVFVILVFCSLLLSWLIALRLAVLRLLILLLLCHLPHLRLFLLLLVVRVLVFTVIIVVAMDMRRHSAIGRRKLRLAVLHRVLVLGTELSLSSRGRMTLRVGEIFWFISHTLPQCHALQGVGDTYL
jgi:hypothetical protein